jgi:hypothetical protein
MEGFLRLLRLPGFTDELQTAQFPVIRQASFGVPVELPEPTKITELC